MVSWLLEEHAKNESLPASQFNVEPAKLETKRQLQDVRPTNGKQPPTIYGQIIHAIREGKVG
jgi:hypothetical protein